MAFSILIPRLDVQVLHLLLCFRRLSTLLVCLINRGDVAQSGANLLH